MNTTGPNERTRIVIWGMALLLIATACGSSDSAGDMSLTWDGESCIYSGPTELTPGAVTLNFVNTSEEDLLNVNLVEILEGHTIDDIVADLGPEPSTRHAPSWTREMGTWNNHAWPGNTSTWEGTLEPGIYAMVCARATPFGVWFGTGLTVEAS